MDALIKIRELSAKYGVSARTLRYYENMEKTQIPLLNILAFLIHDSSAVIAYQVPVYGRAKLAPTNLIIRKGSAACRTFFFLTDYFMVNRAL